MSNTPAQWWHKRWRTSIPTLPTDTVWAAFAAPGVIEARIEALRLEQADPICSACGSSTPEARPPTKWCFRCDRVLPSGEFGRDISKKHKLRAACRACDRERNKLYRVRHALRILGIAS